MATQWMVFKHYAFFMSENRPTRSPTLSIGDAASVRTAERQQVPAAHRWRSVFTFYQQFGVCVPLLNAQSHRSVGSIWSLHLGCLYKLHRRNIFTIFALVVFVYPILSPFFCRCVRVDIVCFSVRFSLFCAAAAAAAFRVFASDSRAKWEAKLYQYSPTCDPPNACSWKLNQNNAHGMKQSRDFNTNANEH